MRRVVIAVLGAAALAAGCTPEPAAQPATAPIATVFDCDGFELRITRTDGAISVETAGDRRTLRQSRQNPLRYEGGGTVALFAPNRTFLEWTSGGTTAACVADT
ncbi:MAG: hypothetical protein KIT43_08015 [Bauldia sp.]|nr:hypothetical protein [Bauldia sp.]MCW5719104.1 hypothetical protein [Bauldia sp.]